MGAWGPWESVEEGSGEAGSEAKKIVELSKYQKKSIIYAEDSCLIANSMFLDSR